jgi:hypothetical protein
MSHCHHGWLHFHPLLEVWISTIECVFIHFVIVLPRRLACWHLGFESSWGFNFFHAPKIENREGAYCFCPVCYSVILSFCPSVILGLAYNFWFVSTRALIFHMIVPYNKAFLLVLKLLTLWAWPWCLSHLLNILPQSNNL